MIGLDLNLVHLTSSRSVFKHSARFPRASAEGIHTAEGTHVRPHVRPHQLPTCLNLEKEGQNGGALTTEKILTSVLPVNLDVFKLNDRLQKFWCDWKPFFVREDPLLLPYSGLTSAHDEIEIKTNRSSASWVLKCCSGTNCKKWISFPRAMVQCSAGSRG